MLSSDISIFSSSGPFVLIEMVLLRTEQKVKLMDKKICVLFKFKLFAYLDQ